MYNSVATRLRAAARRPMPVLFGIAANIFNQLITVIVQIASLPLFLHFWGAERYGEWIIISAVPAYFAMSDIGIVSVATNKMCMLWAQGKGQEANVTFQTAFGGVTLLIGIGSCLCTIVVFAISGRGATTSWALILLVISALLNLYSGLFDACFRLVDRYAAGVYVMSFSRLAEWLACVVAVALGGDFVLAAAATCVARALLQLATGVYLLRANTAIRWGFERASWQELKSLLPHGVAFMGFPLGNALSIQGLTLIVGHLIGVREVVVFNAYRTLSRSITQLITTVSRAVWPRFSALYGKGLHGEANQLRRKAERGVLLAAAAVFVLMSVCGESIVEYWGRGRVPYEPAVFIALLLAAVVTSLYQVKLVALMSTNRHSRVAVHYCLVYLVASLTSWALSVPFGIAGAVASIIAAELGVWAVVTRSFNESLTRMG